MALIHVDEYMAELSSVIEIFIELSPSGGTTLLPVEKHRNCFLPESNITMTTATDRYIHFDSHHQRKTLRGVLQCLRDRAHSLCSAGTEGRELAHLTQVFQANGYPKSFVYSVLYKSRGEPTPSETTDEEEKPKILYLPYVKGVSERIERECKKLGVMAVFKSRHTLRGSLMRVKNTRPAEMKKGAVYEIPCMDCSKVYIGKTGRSLTERVKEHKYAVKRHDEKNRIAAHAWAAKHRVDWSAAKVRTTEQHLWKRKILEAIHIKRQSGTSNLDCGLHLNPIWSPLLMQT